MGDCDQSIICFVLSACIHYVVTSRSSQQLNGHMQTLENHYDSNSSVSYLEAKIVELSTALEKEVELRKAERSSRISLQQRAREEKLQRDLASGFSYIPIGTVRSPFGKRCGTPRQPILCPAAKGRICFNKRLIQAGHFQEISDFSHIWVIWAFHGNTNGDSCTKETPAKVKPPRCSFRVGCLSTRSPHRPNAIGLSVVQVIGVGADYIDICGLDMVDGTPVFDVKPYIPYDIIPFKKPIPMLSWARAGGLEAIELKCPSWVDEADIPFREIIFSSSAEVAIENALVTRKKSGRKNAYYATSTQSEVKSLIKQVLQQDIRGRNSRGIYGSEEFEPAYNCFIDEFCVSFITHETSINVQDVAYT